MISTSRSPPRTIGRRADVARALWISKALRQGRQALSDDPRPADRAGLSRRRRREQASIKAQAGNHADAFADCAQQLDGSVARIRNGDEAPVRKPPCDLKQPLSRPVRQSLMPAACSREALGWRQHGQERERPDTISPWEWREQHERQPAQTRRLDEVAMRGADRIAIDAACLDPRPIGARVSSRPITTGPSA